MGSSGRICTKTSLSAKHGSIPCQRLATIANSDRLESRKCVQRLGEHDTNGSDLWRDRQPYTEILKASPTVVGPSLRPGSESASGVRPGLQALHMDQDVGEEHDLRGVDLPSAACSDAGTAGDRYE